MQTNEPEQFRNLFIAAWVAAENADDPVATGGEVLQRAFEEQERKLREALSWIRDHAIKLRKGTDDWFELVEIEAMATQALKETPDAQ